MGGRSIRSLTQEERDRRREQAQDNFDRIYAEVEAEQRDEWDREFGPEFRAKHPFKADPARIKAITIERIAQQSNNEF